MAEQIKNAGGESVPRLGVANAPLFIDAFSGCGGLSLGLLRAEWTGLFAIEKDPFAFNTYSYNLLQGRYSEHFMWPSWLPREPITVEHLLSTYGEALISLRGKVALLAGGPPCQGFSSAGRRNPSDPRNGLMRTYLHLVQLVEPAMVLLENVRGITVDFNSAGGAEDLVNYSDLLKQTLGHNYTIYWEMANTSDFGVPQARTRFILVALHRRMGLDADKLGDMIEESRRRFLRKNRLLPSVTSSSAISDLELRKNGVVPCSDSEGFDAIDYQSPRTHYQRLMRDGHDGPPSDTRLAHHRPEIVERFSQIISRCNSEGRLNTSIGREMREEYGLKKQALRVLDPQRPAPTITSMPDDLLHYSEPRTLTVRENARLQSFPDWFQFKGKYTTGGHLRRREVPRFTQVANAVPPLMAQVLGSTLLAIWQAYESHSDRSPRSIENYVNQNCDAREIQSVLDKVAS